MLKYGALLFNTIALLIYQFFFTEGITVTQNIPASVKAEGEFTVELVINKGTTSGFAKLQQELPEGFTAVQDDNNGASFTFSAQAVKFIWMSLPSDKEFKVKYKVKVAAGVSGDKTIGGKFSYVVDNVKQSVDIAPSTIKVEGGAVAATTETKTPDNTATNTTTENTSTTNTNTSTTPTNTSSEPSSIVCTRTIPENPSGNFTVELNINKGNISGFAKLLETLPAGLSATAGELQGASFSFNESDGKVKFVWVSMPTVPEFKISYKVIVASGISGAKNIEGVFSYIENDETKKYAIPSTTVNIGGSQPLATNTTTPTDNTAVKTTEPQNTQADNTVAKTDNTTTDNKTTTDNTSGTDNASKSLSATTIPAPQGNINYRVQIAALHNAVDANKLASRFNINQKIDMEMASGYTKYLVGAHGEYKSARDSRETIKTQGVKDAFVTAYNAGKRITVQEALMITAQKWYR
jgi:cell division septation protein DedD